ncbi:Alpha/Beta hydrolase protein [Cokeromyces recurvatus]|uniref:Alpha/Beta hydrolase protein n=1 Tax=Cokeromyces recurvatus TaxID=90255 RepID=UPI00221E74D8|nr:Alpha/Beta hydrolase protein [Cokeromyces recurvatus]KAI7900408.1 Alpha/Beta hydrolase protein [Cokeromyces recurvatus]
MSSIKSNESYTRENHNINNIKIVHHPETVPIRIKYANEISVPFHEYLAQTCPSLFGPKAQYVPTPYLRSRHLQTIYASIYDSSPTKNDITYERQILEFKNGGVASLDWAFPLNPISEDTPTVVILHGLTGGSHENYIRGLLQIITRSPINYRAVVYNARGCGFTSINTPQLFNASITDDLREALSHIQKQIGEKTPLIGIGFSLGSNILVKYLGEEGEKTPFIAAVSIANPYDLLSSGQVLDQGYFSRHVYSYRMAQNLKNIFLRNKDIMLSRGDIDIDEVLAAKTIREYDDACTKKMSNYTTVNNYYRDGSCVRFIENVRIPLLCINALDDPISRAHCIPVDEIKVNPYIILAATKHGGHLGWFEHTYRPSRWIHKPIAEFVIAMFQANDARKDTKKLDTDVVIRSEKAIRKIRFSPLNNPIPPLTKSL